MGFNWKKKTIIMCDLWKGKFCNSYYLEMDDTASSSTTVPTSGVQEIVKKAITEAGNGSSTNGSNTPFRKGRKRVRRPEMWKKNVAKVKWAKGEEYISPSTGPSCLL